MPACPPGSQIGFIELYNTPCATPTGCPVLFQNFPVFNMQRGKDDAASFGFSLGVAQVILKATVHPELGNTVRVAATNISQAFAIQGLKLTLWGVPADHNGPPSTDPDTGLAVYDNPGDGPRVPFFRNRTSCSGSNTVTLTADGWENTAATRTTVTTELAPATGCESVPFAPEIAVAPTNHVAGAPSGYTVDLSVPQSDDPDGLATADVRSATVALPVGTAISAPAASGLAACSDAQVDVGSAAVEECPDASKIGAVRIDTPLLDQPLTGSLYLGTQLSQDPESGKMYRMFLVAAGSGVRIKLEGNIRADAQTGQLTTTFADNPQLPFSKLSLMFDDGDRAPLVNPPACGEYATTGSLSSWAGQSEPISSSFVIDQGCPSGRFAPTFIAGTTNPFAGAFSPFTMTAERTDADQQLSNLKLDLPSGLLGALGSVPLCPEPQAAAGTCGPDSRVGSTTVSVGSGGAPYSLPGTVSLAGPYKGAPFSLSVAVQAKAGPFDLGLVVVRAALFVDANNARATAVSDTFPTIVGGVPIKYRMINIALDRPGFIFNATDCAPATISGTFASVGGAGSVTPVAYQPKGCDQLKLQPELSLQYTGRSQMRKGKHPGVEANLGAIFGQANLEQVQVKLPLTASLDPDNAEALCEASDAAAGHCPAASQIGWASATTPALHVPVQGPVYFVKGTRKTAAGKTVPTLPKLYLKLSGEGVAVDLHADSDVDAKKQLVTTFTDIPDVPIRDFKLRINNGKHGILEATNDVCGAQKSTTVVFTGHNGGKTQRNLRFTAPDCRPQVVSISNSHNLTLPVRVGGIGGGKLAITGSTIDRATRSVRSSDTALVRARFTARTTGLLRRGKRVQVAVRVVYTPAKGAKTTAGKPAKKVTLRKSLTLKPVKTK